MEGTIFKIISFGFIILSAVRLLLSAKADGRKNGDFKYSTPAPRFLQTESNYTYHKGERAILYCSVKNLGTKTVSWRKSIDSFFLTVGIITLVADKRFEVSHIEDSPDWNLMISNVTTTDTGAYECQISSVDRELRKEVYLNVKDEFSYAEPQISITGSLHVDRGMELMLVCNATGAITPPDYIDWFKDGIKIVPNALSRIELRKKLSINSRTISSVLTKAFSEMSDTATYSCRTSDLQVTSVKVNVLNTDKKSKKREPDDSASLVFDNSQSSSSEKTVSLFVMFLCLLCGYLFIQYN